MSRAHDISAGPRRRLGWWRLAVLGLCLSGLVVPSWCIAGEGPKQKVELAYAELRELEGAFRQTSIIRELEQEQQAEGRFFILRPDRVRWDYLKPSRQSAIIRKQEMFLWQEGSREVWPSAYDEKAYGKTPLAVLSGLGTMEKDFLVSVASDNMLLLVPREKGGFIKEIALSIHDAPFPVRSLKVTDVYGNENTFEFLEVKVNAGMPTGIFEPSSLVSPAAASP